jgi:D-3-phosphoglycerate dehydrogenase
VIVRYGIGVDNVDLAVAKECGIPVCNVPDYCIDEVADHTLAFLLGTTRQVATSSNFVKGGRWGLATPIDRIQVLKNMTVGVVGFGRIGREVVSRLRAFKCRILVSDPIAAAADITAAGAVPVSLSDLLAQSDAITLHCPSTAETRGMLNSESLALTKPGVIVINLARGDLIDPAALTASLQSGHVSAAALDVFNPEPIPTDHPILKMDNVIVASHIASVSVTAVRNLRETAANLAIMALKGQPLPNVVNGVVQASA